MANYRYRAVRADGSAAAGEIEAPDRERAVAAVRRLGATPLELVPAAAAVRGQPAKIAKGRAAKAAGTIVSELAVLLDAGLQLDRALALAIENVEDPGARANFAEILRSVREGAPLSKAMAAQPGLFSPTAIAMAEAGEANGRLGDALDRLATMMARAEELRRIVGNAMIYPIALLVIAVGVIAMMLLFVVPQFESLFATSRAQLPAASLFVMGASRFLRDHGLVLLGIVVAGGFALRQAARTPASRAAIDRAVLGVPQLGELVRRAEAARFARTLGALLEGEVPLPNALMLAQRTLANSAMAGAIAQIAAGVREGGGLTAPLAAAKVFPRLAIGFFRTGEETSRLGPMLSRLADVLDRDVRLRLERVIGILTPAITVFLGTAVAAIIASIMSAILGFNDLAVSS
jgi:general secretion pathway protein F